MRRGNRQPALIAIGFLLVASACSSDDSTERATTSPSVSASTTTEAATPTTSPADPDPEGFFEFGNDIEPPDFGTSTDLAAAREANGGVLPAQEALDLFAAVFGEVPGADRSRFEPRPEDGSLGIRAVFRVWQELTPEQQRAVETKLNPPGPQAAPSHEPVAALFRPAEGRFVYAGPDVASEAARAQAALEAELGRPLGIELDLEIVPAGTVTVRGEVVNGWAHATNAGVVAPDGPADGCLVRVDTDVAYRTLVHELFHCFQYDSVGNARTVYDTQDWIVEGSAAWVAARIAGADSASAAWGQQWVLSNASIFAIDYPGIGFFWTIEDMGVDPFDVVLDMLGKANEEAVATTGLDPGAVLPRIPSEKAEAHTIGPTFSVSGVWQLTAPDAPNEGTRMVGTVTRSSPIDRTFSRPGWAPLYPGQATIDGEGIVHVRVTADAGFVEFEDKENFEVFGLFDRRFCLREEGCTCGLDDEVDSELPEASEHLLLTGIRRGAGELTFLVELEEEPDEFPDGEWEGTFSITSVRFGASGSVLVGATRDAPFTLTVEEGAITEGEYVWIQDQRIDMSDGGFAEGVGTLQGVFSGCSYLPVMTAGSVSFEGIADLNDGLGIRPFNFIQPMPPVPGTRPWDFTEVTEDFVSGSIDASPDIAFMRSSGLDFVDDVTITFVATRTG